MTKNKNGLPLSGITVVSLEQAIAAPLASRHLADWGARVIKVERPSNGDFCRDYDYVLNGLSSQFVWTNRSKESLALDIKATDDRQTLETLLGEADVFLQNLAPGAAQRLGLDAKALIERFPRLIACDISGYGSGGPYSEKKAYDLLVQCETGFLSINGTEEHPAKGAIAIADIATGMYVLNGVLMALYARERTGRGTAFEVSLFDAMTEWMSYPSLYTEGAGKPLKRTGMRHATIAPYGPFKTGDGKTVFFGIQNQREWLSLCTNVFGDPHFATNPLFATNPDRMMNRDQLEKAIEDHFSSMTSDEVLAKLESASIANARLNTVEEFLEHPQLSSRNRVTTVDTPNGAVTSYLPAITIPNVQPHMGPVPAVGQHTQSILAQLSERKLSR
ncbi:CaiB/BaiF CoA transferase family protein [Tardiphaga sp.]|jgi:itaconate CoA-transferase|uniref:CaiB/BaiF CoA transferase family protein n=1 Tax=Tardiphaga sp. TaxID=1926292 RepID=UPI0037D9C6A5